MINVEATASGHLTRQCAPHLMWEVQDVHLLCGIIANDCNQINCKYIAKDVMRGNIILTCKKVTPNYLISSPWTSELRPHFLFVLQRRFSAGE